MSDTDLLLGTLATDTAFAGAFPHGPPAAATARLAALEAEGDVSAFLLAAMALAAQARNAHTRLIPNAAITVLPHRFVALGAEVWLTEGEGAGARLEAINGQPTEALLAAAAPLLPAPPARQRALAPLLFAWPEALAALGLAGPIRYSLSTGPLRADMASRVPATSLYPAREHGRLAGSPGTAAPPLVEARPRGAVTHVRLTEFHTPDDGGLEAGLHRAAEVVLSRPGAPLVLDLRGNPGGNFLKAERLLEALRSGWSGPRLAVLVDKFTFSAALVFACRALFTLPGEGRLMGEPMGDVTRFHAEGGLVDLPWSGAALRFCDAFHDWEEGQPHPTTPAIIARHLLAAGQMRPAPTPFSTPAELARGEDRALDAALGWAGG